VTEPVWHCHVALSLDARSWWKRDRVICWRSPTNSQGAAVARSASRWRTAHWRIDRDRSARRGANEYVITWKVPLQKEAKTNFSCVIGSVAHEDVEPGFCTVGLLADPLKMRVRTFDVTGKPAKRPFQLAAFRD
jgi:hypothetical protein